MTKPRSKANFQTPDAARIKGRIERLQATIAKHEARLPDEKSAAKIAECYASIVNYRAKARELIDSLTAIAGE